MNTLQSKRRTQLKARFTLECLDERVVPSAMHATAGAGAEAIAAVATAQTQHQMHLARVAARHAQHLAQVAARHHMAAAPVVAVNVSSQTQATATGPVSQVSPAFTPPARTGTPTPAAPSNSGTGTSNPTTTTSGNPGSGTSSPGPLPANVSQPLQTLYQNYKNGADIFKTGEASFLKVDGTNVGVQIHANGGDFNSLVAELKNAGMQIQTASDTFATVEGMLPIDQLAKVAQFSQTLSVTPLYNPIRQ
jgi:hypothetical protein